MRVAVYTAFVSSCDEAKELNGHVTTSFTWMEGRMPKLQTCSAQGICTVKDVVYFEGADVTVALVASKLAEDRHKVLTSIGLKYEHEYLPHVTICKGNKVVEFTQLIGINVMLHSEYIGFFTKD